MLLEGNGFIKVLTPMKATVWSHVDIYKLLCLKNVCFWNELASSLSNSVSQSGTLPVSENGLHKMLQIDVPGSLGPRNENKMGNEKQMLASHLRRIFITQWFVCYFCSLTFCLC